MIKLTTVFCLLSISWTALWCPSIFADDAVAQKINDIIDDVVRPGDGLSLTYVQDGATEEELALIQPYLPVPTGSAADATVKVTVEPVKGEPSKHVVSPTYLNNQSYLNARGEPIQPIVVPADVEVAVVTDPAQVKDHPNAFIVIYDAVKNCLSFSVGETLANEQRTSIWWQQGEPHDPKMHSLSADAGCSFPARSMIFLSKIQNTFAKGIVDRIHFDFRYRYVGRFGDDAMATMSGFSNPRRFPSFDWDGIGDEKGMELAVRIELGHGFFLAPGLFRYSDSYTMAVGSVDRRLCPADFTCPRMKTETVTDPSFTYLGFMATIGYHLSKRSSIEFSLIPGGEPGWSRLPVNEQYPAGWHSYSYNISFREKLTTSDN